MTAAFAAGSFGPQPVRFAPFEPQKTCFVLRLPLLFGSAAAACIFAFFLPYTHLPVCVCMCLLCLAFVYLRFEYLDYFEVFFWVMSKAALTHTFRCTMLLACFSF